MIPRPRFRMPLWVAIVLALGAYAVRSAARGFDFTPDIPGDVVVLVALLIVVSVVWWLRADDARRDAAERAAIQPDATDPEA